MERTAQMRNFILTHERTLQFRTDSDDDWLLHYCFTVWKDTMQESTSRRMIEAEKGRLARTKLAYNEKIDRTFAKSHLAGNMLYCVTVWNEVTHACRQADLQAAVKEFDSAIAAVAAAAAEAQAAALEAEEAQAEVSRP